MDLPISSSMSTRNRGVPFSLALVLHAGFALSFLAVIPKTPEVPSEPAIRMELVEWTPPAPAPIEQMAPLPPAPVQPAPAQPKAAVAKPLPVAAKPAPAAKAAAADISPTATETAAPDAATMAAAEAPAAAAAAPAASGTPGPVVDEPYVPPSSNAAYLSNPKPAYPSLAQKRGWEGIVTLSVAVDESGQPLDVQIKSSSGYSVLDRCAVEAVQRWRFVPARRGGRNVAANVEVPIRFGLESATG